MTAAQQLMRRSKGLSVLKQDGVIDARGVFDSVIAYPVKTPNDKQLLLHALAFREHLEDGSVDQLYWFDARAMLADGMTKGSVDREALVTVRELGEWHLSGDEPVRARKSHGGDPSPAGLPRTSRQSPCESQSAGASTSKPRTSAEVRPSLCQRQSAGMKGL